MKLLFVVLLASLCCSNLYAQSGRSVSFEKPYIPHYQSTRGISGTPHSTGSSSTSALNIWDYDSAPDNATVVVPDTAAFQSRLDNLESNGGGVLYCADDLYTLNGIDLGANTLIQTASNSTWLRRAVDYSSTASATKALIVTKRFNTDAPNYSAGRVYAGTNTNWTRNALVTYAGTDSASQPSTGEVNEDGDVFDFGPESGLVDVNNNSLLFFYGHDDLDTEDNKQITATLSSSTDLFTVTSNGGTSGLAEGDAVLFVEDTASSGLTDRRSYFVKTFTAGPPDTFSLATARGYTAFNATGGDGAQTLVRPYYAVSADTDANTCQVATAPDGTAKTTLDDADDSYTVYHRPPDNPAQLAGLVGVSLYGAQQGTGTAPSQNDYDESYKCGGYFGCGMGARIQGVTVFGFDGTGVYLERGQHTRNGNVTPADRLEGIIDDLYVTLCYRGLHLGKGGDNEVHRLNVNGVRDECAFFEDAGSVKMSGTNHLYGGTIGLRLDGNTGPHQINGTLRCAEQRHTGFWNVTASRTKVDYLELANVGEGPDWTYTNTAATADSIAATITENESAWTDSGGDLLCTSTGHGFTDEQQVACSSDTTLPTGVSATMYIVYVNANTFKLSATAGGAAVTFTDDGTGNHTVTASDCIASGDVDGDGDDLMLILGADHKFLDNDPVIVTTSTTLPTGIVANAVYYVQSRTATTIKLASGTTRPHGTTPDYIDYSDTGTGTQTVTIFPVHARFNASTTVNDAYIVNNQTASFPCVWMGSTGSTIRGNYRIEGKVADGIIVNNAVNRVDIEAEVSGTDVSITEAAGSWTDSGGSLLCTSTDHGFLDHMQVACSSDNTLPTNVASTMYIVYVNANSFMLSTTPGGSAVAYSDAGTGNHTVASTNGLNNTILYLGQWADLDNCDISIYVKSTTESSSHIDFNDLGDGNRISVSGGACVVNFKDSQATVLAGGNTLDFGPNVTVNYGVGAIAPPWQ